MKSVDVDVLVVGGGPAGSAAALTLLTYSSLRVAVVEASAYTRVRVGETVSPGVQPLLHYLGAWERFMAAEHLPAFATAAAWGNSELRTRDFLFTGRGSGWHLDRRRFDQMLAELVVERGGTLYTNTRLLECEQAATGDWQAKLLGPDGALHALRAALVIDTSGRKAVVARRAGATQQIYDRLVGVAATFAVAHQHQLPQMTLVEAAEYGWWYAAMLPDGKIAVALMSDADLLRSRGLNQAETWQQALATTEYIRQYVAGCQVQGGLRIYPAHSCMLEPAAGPGWVATGDAVAAFDPLSSMGIGHALASGSHAGRVAYDQLRSDGTLAAQYSSGVAQNVQQYLRQRQQYYRLEQRWADQPFWARRHQPAVVLAGQAASVGST